MRARWIVLVAATACNALVGVHDFAPLGDGSVDAGPDIGPCEPDAVTCTSASNAVQKCASDGSGNALVEACAAGCVPGTPVHCAYLEPRWAPDACDAIATRDLFMPATSSVSSDGALCTELVNQTAGPAICVARYRRIEIASGVTLTITGSRPVAFIADTELVVAGSIVAAARGRIDGPGGGQTLSGTASAHDGGGGGAGFATAGGKGGLVDGTCGACSGGPAIDPLARPVFSGGAKAPSGATLEPHGGGGGGGVVLAACRGTVSVTGSLDLGGGGGEGQRDLNAGTGYDPSTAGAGGGAGGYLVVEGLAVTVSGGVYANGGGGGGATTFDGGLGGAGHDGPAAVAAATGGIGTGQGENGGAGGFRDVAARPGGSPPIGGGGQPGGGGGSHGAVSVLAPDGVAAMVSTTLVSALVTTGTAKTR